MSTRENIASNIVTVLTAISSPITLKKITRQPFEPRDLSQQQYPCAWVESAEETREDISTSDKTRQGTVDFVIMGFVQGAESNIDTARNQLITAIETALDLDRTRDSNALDTEVISIETDEGTIFPLGGIRMVARCIYTFTSGTP
jgi:hypothetical protein|tara:strand:+ start:180 stop:614 length:435 start_codon:yes stop_codon:yes gene_type:complete